MFDPSDMGTQVDAQVRAYNEEVADAMHAGRRTFVALTPPSAGSLDHLLIDDRNHGPNEQDRPANSLEGLSPGVELEVEDSLRMARAGYWHTMSDESSRIDYLNPRDFNKDALMIPFELFIVKSTTSDTGYDLEGSSRFFGVGHEVALLADRAAFIDPATGRYNGALFDEYLNSTITVRQEEVVREVPGKVPGEVRTETETIEVEVPKRRVVNPDEVYQYNPFAFNLPMLGKEANAYADLRSPLVAGAGSEYNYKSHDYEYFSIQLQNELWLPNIYATYLTKGAIKEDPQLGVGELTNRQFIDHTNLGGAFTEQLQAKKDAHDDYFRQWARAWSRLNSSFERGDPRAVNRTINLRRVVKSFVNVYFDPDEVSALRDMNRHKNFFPFYNEIQFNTERESEFVNLLQATGLTNRFIFGLMMHNSTAENLREFADYVEQKEVINATEAVDEAGEVQVVDPERGYEISQNTRRVREVGDMINRLRFDGQFNEEQMSRNESRLFNGTIFGKRGFQSLLTEEGRFERNILDKIFYAKLEQMLKKYFVSWDTSFSINSDPTVCHSETVAYRVEKNRVNQDTNQRTFVQNFFFLNTPTLEDVEIIDTQVKFGEYYEYTIFAHKLVFGTKYRYSTPYPEQKDLIQAADAPENKSKGKSEGETRETESATYGVPISKNLTLNCEAEERKSVDMERVDKFKFCVFSEPYAHFVEVPYKSFKPVKVTDRNPAIPHMLIVPYRQVTDRVLINLNSGMDDYVDQPISILEEDDDHFEEVRRASGLPPEAPIRFKTDDGLGRDGYFEVWRLDRRPEKYEDFSEGEVSTVRPSEHSRLNPDSGALTLFLKQNKKYYICSRVVDGHGNISNPTEVHEVELVYDDGVMFFREKTIELKPIEPPRTLEKPMKRFVKICPNLTQSVISGKFEDGLMDADTAMEFRDVKLGEAERSVWGRKFKIRFVSRDTGRKIDLNLDFTRSHTKVYGQDEN